MSTLSIKRVLAKRLRYFAAGNYNDCHEDDKYDDDYQQHFHQHHH